MLFTRSSQVTSASAYIEQAVHKTFWSSAGASLESHGRSFSGGTPDSKAFNKSRVVVGTGIMLFFMVPITV